MKHMLVVVEKSRSSKKPTVPDGHGSYISSEKRVCSFSFQCHLLSQTLSGPLGVRIFADIAARARRIAAMIDGDCMNDFVEDR